MAGPPSRSASLDLFDPLDADCPSRSAGPDLIDPTRDDEISDTGAMSRSASPYRIDPTRDDENSQSHFEMGIKTTGLQAKTKREPRKYRKRTKKGKKVINKDGYTSGSGCDMVRVSNW